MERKRPVFYPLLIAAYPVAALYAQNSDAAPPSDLGATHRLDHRSDRDRVAGNLARAERRRQVRHAHGSGLACVRYHRSRLRVGQRLLDRALRGLGQDEGTYLAFADCRRRTHARGHGGLSRVANETASSVDHALNIFALILLALPTATIARRWSEHPRELVQPESPTDPPPAAIASAATEQDASPTFSISSWMADREPT